MIDQPPVPTTDPGDDGARLEALIDRLTELEGGLRAELDAQVRRADAAEAALVAAEARATTAEIQARTAAPPTVAAPPSVAAPRAVSPPAASGGEELLVAERDALREALSEMKRHLERRRRLEGEVLSIAREAVGSVGGDPLP